MIDIKIKKLVDSAIIPTQGSEFAAGYDLYTVETYKLEPGERHLFKTGISMAIPFGNYGRIAPRSGLAFKKGIDVMAGVIDSDYRGELGVLLINLNNTPIELPLLNDKGEKTPIAQIIFESYSKAKFEEASELPASSRGAGGFGNSDNKVTTTIIKLPAKPNLVDLYSKTGGVHIKEKYSEEVRKRTE